MGIHLRGTGRTQALSRLLLFSALSLTGPATAQAQISRLPVPDTTTGDFFGGAVAVDGPRILVGASGRDTCGPSSGAAFVFERTPTGAWGLTAHLEAEDCEPGEYFGRSVALEGDVAVVTSYVPTPFAARSNAVYVFELADGAWTQTARLTDPVPEEDGPFASAVVIDGARILVTSSGDTAAGRFGGTASVFERDAVGRWHPVSRFSAPHDARRGVFGTSAALHGRRAVVTASTYGLGRPGTAHIFEQDENGEWQLDASLQGMDDYFLPVDLHGDRLIVGQTRDGTDHTGRAAIYERGDSGWQRIAELKPDSPYPGGGFGSAVALSGDVAAVVGFDEQLKLEFNIDRVVFVFERSASGKWEQRRIVDVGEVYFGASLDLDGETAAIGQASEEAPGQVYVATVR